MRYALRATEARKNYSQVMEEAVRVMPQTIQRLRDTVFWISAEHLETMLSHCQLTLRVRQDEDGSYYGVLDEIDVMESADTIDALKRNMAEAVKEYAESYIEDFGLYYNSPNRRQHLPYVWRVMMQDDIQGVEGLFDAVMV